MYKYYLTYNGIKTQLEKEPIGWDDFSTTLKRNDKSHGISAEFSQMNLKFYCLTSMAILRDAYNMDIDSTVIYSVENDGVEEYSGNVDFAEYNDTFDKYDFIQVRVSEIGVQSTFNNRVEQKIDIDSLTAFEGANLTEYSNLNKVITLPGKEIKFTSFSENKDLVEGEIGQPFLGQTQMTDYGYFRIDFAFAEGIFNELNNFFGIGSPVVIYGGHDGTHVPYNDASPIFVKNNPDGVSYKNYKVEFNLSGYISINLSSRGATLGKIMIQKGDSREIVYTSGDLVSDGVTPGVIGNKLEFDIAGSYESNDVDKLYLCAEMIYSRSWTQIITQYDWAHSIISCGLNSGSYFKISALSVVNDTTARLSMIHETMSRIAENITNNYLTVKSDYYGRGDSEVNPTFTEGPGSYKAISNGLRVRNALMSDNSIPKITLSFSDLMKGLQPIDNIGYGFSKEAGNLFLRVEPWTWFYNDTVVFEITNPSKVTRTVNPSGIFTRFKCGFKKYETEDTNGSDGLMSDREFSTRVKLVDTLLEQLSEFIADSYAIEYTRRLTLNRDTKDWKYDNDIFLFVLKHVTRYLRVTQGGTLMYQTVLSDGFAIDQGVTDSDDTIISPGTLYNGRISPERIAHKWINRIFQYLKTGNVETLKFNAGTGNITAKLKPVSLASKTISISGEDPVNTTLEIYGYHESIDEVITENDNIQSDSVALKAETITIDEYPLSRTDYISIKNSPYGIIKVDGESCYLKSMNYKFKSGLASLTLIPKF